MKVMNDSDAYRLDALLELAAAYPASRTAREIARRRAIPPAFLARLLAELARAALVITSRGPRGGVRLAAPPEAIALAPLFPAEPPPGVGGAAVHWLSRRLAQAHAGAVAGLDLAGLAQVEREQEATPAFEI